MRASRWSTLLLAALTAVGGLLYAVREPVEVPTAQDPAPVAALPLNLPTSQPASVARPHAPAAPARLQAPAASAPRIGSEGYGPHIERAQAGGDAAAAWEAVQWLRQCASNAARRQSYESVRGERIPQEMLTQLMLEADAEERLCQTVTAWHRTMLPELMLRAIRGKVPQAAMGFAALVNPADIEPVLRQQVVDALRRDANDGQPASLLGAATEGAAWGMGDDERLAYLAAFAELAGDSGSELVRQWIAEGSIQFKAEPSAQQLSAAQLAGRQIAERLRAAGRP